MRTLLPAILLTLLVAGCSGLFGDDDDVPSDCDPILGCDPGHPITLRLVNTDDEPAHLFSDANNETFPCCRVEAGQSRTVTVSDRAVGDRISVRAGRNSQIIVGHSCIITNAQRAADLVIATFVGNGWGCS